MGLIPTAKVTGQREIARAFRKLGPKVGKKPIRKGARAGAKVMAAEVRKRAPVGRTRQLRKQVKVRTLKAKRGDILIGAITGRDDGFYGHILEYGRGPGGWHEKRLPEDPFIRPAFEASKVKANREAAEVIAAETNKEIKKL